MLRHLLGMMPPSYREASPCIVEKVLVHLVLSSPPSIIIV